MRRSLLALVLLLAACAPGGADPVTSGDEMTGTLRVWLFDEANRQAKEAVVNEAVKEFEAAHPGVKVDVGYLATETRAERYKGALNDPASAPDVTEIGNTDLAGFVASNGMADVTAELSGWAEAADLPAELLDTVKVGGKAGGKVYGVPWWLGVRALYYRTDLGITPPTSYLELVAAARQVRAQHKDLLGIAVGGRYVFGALPFVWDAGGDIATRSGDASTATYTAALGTPTAKAGIKNYTDLFSEDICPPRQCVDLTGGGTVEAFAAGRAGMAILGNFNRSAVQAGAVKGKYAVVPLPGVTPGTIAPAFAGGNNLGVFRATRHRTLAARFMLLLAGKRYSLKLYDAMGFLPALTSARAEVVAKEPFLKPFVDTMAAGTRFVPVHQAWTTIDAQRILPNLLQKVITGQATVDQAAAEADGLLTAAFTGS